MKLLQNQKGAAMVEFAIVVIPLMMLVFGIIEFGILLYDKAVITNASREGARAGIVYNPTPLTEAEIKTVVNNYCSDHLITFGADKSPDVNVVFGSGSGQPLTVTVDFRYDFLVLPNFADSLGSFLNLNAVTVMRME